MPTDLSKVNACMYTTTPIKFWNQLPKHILKCIRFLRR